MTGKKFDEEKPQMHLLVRESLEGTAKAFQYGAKKYNKWNYRNGIEYTRLCDSLQRHLLAYLNGEDIDNESGMPHTWLMGANIHMLEFMRVHKPEMDDRYKINKQTLSEAGEITNDVLKEKHYEENDLETETFKETKMMQLFEGMKIEYPDGKVINISVTGTYPVKAGARIVY